MGAEFKERVRATGGHLSRLCRFPMTRFLMDVVGGKRIEVSISGAETVTNHRLLAEVGQHHLQRQSALSSGFSVTLTAFFWDPKGQKARRRGHSPRCVGILHRKTSCLGKADRICSILLDTMSRKFGAVRVSS